MEPARSGTPISRTPRRALVASPRAMRAVSFAIAVALSLPLASRASARVPDAPAVSYRAPAACPVEETFLQRLRARLGTSHGAASTARTLDVQIAASNGRYVGKLSLAEADGRTTAKTLDAADCGELVDALSLVAALALATDDVDGSGRNRGDAPSPAPATAPAAPGTASTPGPAPPTTGAASAPTPASTPGSTPSAPGSAFTPAPGSARTPAPASAPGPAPAPASEETAAPALETAPGSTPSRFGLALGGLVAVGPGPRALFGASLSMHWAPVGAAVFAPALDIGGAASLSPDVPEAKGTARFAWLTARALVYLVQLPVGAGVVVRGGAAGSVGVLLARGHDTTAPATSTRPWASLGVVAGVEVPLGSRFAIQPDVSLEAPLRRDRYAFGSSDFFQVPVVIATGGVSVVAYLR